MGAGKSMWNTLGEGKPSQCLWGLDGAGQEERNRQGGWVGGSCPVSAVGNKVVNDPRAPATEVTVELDHKYLL